jgi:hypothetical protein
MAGVPKNVFFAKWLPATLTFDLLTSKLELLRRQGYVHRHTVTNFAELLKNHKYTKEETRDLYGKVKVWAPEKKNMSAFRPKMWLRSPKMCFLQNGRQRP